MRIVLERRDEDCDENNLMRLVQGSIVPQVNAGMAATAESFLQLDENEEFPTFDTLHEHTNVLLLRDHMRFIISISYFFSLFILCMCRVSVVTFMVLSAQLVLKAKRVLHLDTHSASHDRDESETKDTSQDGSLTFFISDKISYIFMVG